MISSTVHTDKKENQNFLICRKIQNGAVAKSYMTNGLPVYGEIFAHFLIYKEALPHIWLCNCSTLNFLILYEENFYFLFYQYIGKILCTIPGKKISSIRTEIVMVVSYPGRKGNNWFGLYVVHFSFDVDIETGTSHVW